jgi:uncharacterized membrane protein affecting hemolysin expression
VEAPSKDQISSLAQDLERQKAQSAGYLEQYQNLKEKVTVCEERLLKSSADIHIYKVILLIVYNLFNFIEPD